MKHILEIGAAILVILFVTACAKDTPPVKVAPVDGKSAVRTR